MLNILKWISSHLIRCPKTVQIHSSWKFFGVKPCPLYAWHRVNVLGMNFMWSITHSYAEKPKACAIKLRHGHEYGLWKPAKYA